MHMYVWGNGLQYSRPWGQCFLHLLLLVSEYSSKSTIIFCLSLIGPLQAIYLIHHFNSKCSKHVTWNMYNKPLQPWNVSQYWSATCRTLASRNMHWPGFFEWPTNPQQTNQKDRTQTKPTSFPSQLLTSKQLLFPQEVPQAKITVPSTIHPTIFCIFSQRCFPKGLVVVPVIYNTCGMTWTGSVAVWHASWRPKTRRRQLFGKPWRTVGEGHGVPPGAGYT